MPDMHLIGLPPSINGQAAAWLTIVPVSFALFLGWLIIFALAWVFPRSWKMIGIVSGLLWGLGPLAGRISSWSGSSPGSGLMVTILSFWEWGALPFVAVAEAMGLTTGSPGLIIVSLIGGLILGLTFAWTGNFFRLFL